MKHQHFFHQKPGTKSSHVNFDSPAKQWKKDFFIECAHNHICYRQFMLVVEWSVGQGPNFIHLVSFMLADQTTVLYMSGKSSSFLDSLRIFPLTFKSTLFKRG